MFGSFSAGLPVGAHDDPVENIRDVGEGFVTAVGLAVGQQPARFGAVYWETHRTLAGLLDVVQGSILSDGQAVEECRASAYLEQASLAGSVQAHDAGERRLGG